MNGKKRLSAAVIARCGIMGGLLFGSQLALAPFANFETVTPLLIIFTIVYGKEAFFAAAVFDLCELAYWGFGLWWISYLYVWSLLILFTLAAKKLLRNDPLLWAAFAAVFGLSFGGLFAAVYIPVSPAYAYSYWLAGLSFDITHGIFNFLLTLALYKPVTLALKKVREFHGQ